MKFERNGWRILGALLLFAVVFPAMGQEAEQPNEKAARYHSLLLKKPGNAMVFSRFVDAWLDTGSKKGLTGWLASEAEKGVSADWRVLGALHQYLGEDEEALKALNEAVKLDAESADLRLARAKMQARLLAFEAALIDLEVAAKDEKTAIEASKLKGVYLARSGQVEEAVKAWKEVIAAYPKDEELREDLIEVEVIEGLYKDAIEASTGLVEMTKDTYKKTLRRLRLGDIQILAGDREAGLKTYEEIMSATGEGTWLEREVLAQVERVFLKEDDIKGLRDFYQKLREEHPRRVSIRKVLARQMAMNDEMKEAIALFREVLKITPGDMGNREEFVAFLESNEKWKEAKEELVALIEQRKEDALLWERLARIEVKLNDQEALKAALAKVAELKKETAEGLLATAALYEQAKLLEEAEALFREGRTAFPDSLEVAEGLASFLIQNKKEEEALEIWKGMAKGADREGLLRVARSLSSHGKGEVAFGILGERIADFENDSLVLTQYCKLASSLEEASQAIPQGLALVNQATTPTELEGAVQTALRLIARAEKKEEIRKTLSEQADLGVPGRCLLAAVYADQGDSMKAEEVLSKAVDLPDGLLARFYRVKFEEDRGNLEEAIAMMREIIETPEGRKTVHLRRLVELLDRSGDVEKALAAVDDWKRIAPGDHSAWKRRARLLQANGQPDEAVVELRRMIGKFGADEERRAELASALIEAAEYTPAQRIYEQLYSEAEKLETKLKWAGQLAQLAEKEGKLEELLEDFDRRKRSNPRSVAPLLAIAEIHRVLDQYEERRSALLEASRRRPEDTQLLARIAEVEERAGEYDRAVGILRDAVKRDKTPESKRRLASLLLKNGEVQGGLDLLSEIPKTVNDPRGIEGVVQALLSAQETEHAINFLQKHIEKHDVDWRLQYLHAMVLKIDGQGEKALELFTSLLRGGEEISGLKPLVAGQNANQNMGPWKALFGPNGWIELTPYQPYVSRRNFNPSNQGMAPRVALPGTPRELQLLSLLQGSSLLADVPEKDQEEARKALSLPGIKDVDILSSLMSGGQGNAQKLLEDRAKENPDNLGLFALSLAYRANEGGISAKEFEKAEEVLLKEYPETFAMIAFSAMQSPAVTTEKLAGALGRAMESLSQEKSQDLMEMMSMFTFSPYASQSSGGKDLKPIKNLMVEEALATVERPKKWGWMPMVVSYLLTEGKTDEALTLINRHCEWKAEDKNPVASGWMGRMTFGGSSRSGKYLSAPAFPPRSLDGVPNSFLSLFPVSSKKGAANDEGDAKAKLLARLQLENEDESGQALPKIGEKASEIKNLALRALAFLSNGNDDEAQKLIEEMLGSREESSLLFAAGYLHDHDDARAYEALLKARMLPLSRELRKRVDGHLAIVGSTLAGEKDLKIDLEPAKRAALRLRRVLNMEERDELGKILIKLGLESEAERLAAAPKPSVTPARPGMSSSRNQQDRITELRKAGNIDGAAREAAKQFRTLLNGRGREWELNDLKEKLTSKELRDETLKKLDPGESESTKRLLEFAKAQQLFGTKEKARELFEKILAKDSDHIEALVGSVTNTPFSEIDQSKIIVRKDDKIDVEASGRIFDSLWSNVFSNGDLDQSVGLCKLTASFLEALPASTEADRNLSWVPYYILKFARGTSVGESRLAVLVDSGNGYGNGSSEIDEEATKIRNAAAKSVFSAMLKHPQIVEQGFMLLESAREGLDLKDDRLVELARASLVKVVERKEGGNFYSPDRLWAKFHSHGGSSSSGELYNAKDPMTWLMAHAAKTETEMLTPELSEKLKKAQPERFALLERARALAKAEPAEAEELYAAWKEELPELKREKAIAFTKQILLFSPKDGAWADDLESLLFKSSNSANSHGYRGMQVGWPKLIGNWASWRCREGGEEKYEALLLALFEDSFGPSDSWEILAELGEGGLPQKYRQAGYGFQEISKALFKETSLVKPTLRFLAKHPLEDFVYELDEMVQGAWGRRYGSAESSLEAILKHQLLVLTSNGDEVVSPTPKDVFAVVEGLRGIQFSNAERERKELSDLLAKEKDLDPVLQKFAEAALLEKREGRAVILPVLEENLDLVNGLIEESPEKSFEILRAWFPKMEEEEISDSLKEIFAEFAGSARAEKQVVMKEHIEKGFPNFMEKGADDVWDEVLAMAQLDEELGEKLVLKILNDVKNAPESRGRSSSNGVITLNRDRWAEELISRLGSGELEMDLPQRVRLVDAVYRDGVSDFLREPMGLRSYNSTWAWKMMIADHKEGVRSIPELLKSLDADEQASFAVLISDGALSPRSGEFEPFLKEEGAFFKGSPVLWNVFGVAKSYRAAKGNKSGSVYKAARAHYLELFKSEALPVVLKVDLLSRITSRSADLNSESEILKMIPTMMAEYASTDRNLAGSSLNKTLTALGDLDLKKFATLLGPLVDEAEASLLSKKSLALLRDSNDPPALEAVIKLALVGDRSKLAGQLLRKNYGQYRGELEIMMKLGEVGNFEVVRKLVASGAGTYNDKGLGHYDKEFHEQVTKILEEVPEENRYHLEVALSNLRDVPKGKLPAFQTPRGARLEALAQAFQERGESLKGDARLQVLAIFSSHNASASILEKELREVHDRLTIADSFVFSRNSSQVSESPGHEILRRVMSMNAAAGNFEPILAKLQEFQEVLKGDGNSIWQLRYQRDPVYGFVAKQMIIFAGKSSENAELTIPYAKRCFEMAKKEKNDVDPMHSLDGACLIIYSLAGRDQDWKKEIEALEGAEKKRYQDAAAKRRYSTIFEDIFDDEWKRNNRWQLRRKIVRTLLNSAYYREREIEYVHDFYGLSNSGLAAYEQVIKEVEDLPKDHPLKLEATFHIASVKAYKLKGRNGKKAVAAYDVALALAREMGTKEKVNQILAHRCDILFKNNRKALAKKEAAKVQLDLLSERDQKWVKKALPKWLEE